MTFSGEVQRLEIEVDRKMMENPEPLRPESYRHCIRCNKSITACNGFCLARDILNVIEHGGRSVRPEANIRELCGLCVLRLDHMEFMRLLE
jgi:hypothetical protein